MAFKCDHCNSSFINKSTLNRHLRNIHQLQFGNLDNKLCPICSKRGNKKSILNHFKTDHGLSLEITYKLFADLSAFYEWKKEIENETVASFVKVRQSQILKDGSKVIYFHCHRDGVFTPSGSKKRNIKILGSNKINAFCPAQMTIRVDSSCVSVKFIETHVGHAKEFSRINYYKDEKKNIPSLKMSLETIEEANNSGINISNKTLSIEDDVLGLENLQNINYKKKPNFSESLDAWILEKKSNCCSFVRFHKPKGVTYESLQKEDVVSVFFTDVQIELLRIYGDDIICVDGTHSLSKRVIQVFTLLVLDSNRQGLPCAFMITNRTDVKVFKMFFETVRSALGSDLKPAVFMSDINGIIYNGWLSVMPPAEKYLYSWWYVDREWQSNLKKKVPSTKHSEVYKKLRALLEENNECHFREKLKQTLNCFRTDLDTVSFAEYFSSSYDRNVESWAYCFRLHAGLNININLEKLHKTFKYIFLKGKNINQIGDAISNILNLIKSRTFDSLKSIEKEKAFEINKTIEKLHEVTLGMEKNISSVVKSGDEWVILCNDSNSYKIQKLKEDCICHTKCPFCHICVHLCTCSCFDNSIHWNVCSHMHYICTSFKGMDTIDFSATFGERDYFEIAMSELAPTTALSEGSSETESELLSYKEQAKEKLLSILDLINKSNSIDEVKSYINLIDQLSSAVNIPKLQESVIT